MYSFFYIFLHNDRLIIRQYWPLILDTNPLHYNYTVCTCPSVSDIFATTWNVSGLVYMLPFSFPIWRVLIYPSLVYLRVAPYLPLYTSTTTYIVRKSIGTREWYLPSAGGWGWWIIYLDHNIKFLSIIVGKKIVLPLGFRIQDRMPILSCNSSSQNYQGCLHGVFLFVSTSSSTNMF